jgi:hypothetical protein
MKLKLLVLCTLFSLTLSATPFWSHPNTQVYLPEPTILFTTDLNLNTIQTQFPQFNIHYTDGLVGYFKDESTNPIWTVKNTNQLFDELFESKVDKIEYQTYRPATPPSTFMPVPPSNGKPPCWSNGRPKHGNCDGPGNPPPGSSDVPEPLTFYMIGLGLVGLASLKSNVCKR